MELAKEYVINDPEDLLECPYESAHMVRAKRMAYHLAKCRLHHACTEMARCPYNASHEVYTVELRYHMAICEDKQRVQGKIAQERMEQEGEVKGCIETPGYKPLNIWGDSWEDDVPTESCFTRGRVALKEQPKREPEEQKEAEERVLITEAEKQGLTGRQLQKLYLKKQKELQQAKEQATQRKPAAEEKLRVPTQPSQSLAIHHQQQHRQQQDIYQQALKDQQDRVLTLGRGRALLLGPNPLLGAGRGLVGSGPAQPAGVGAVNVTVNGNVGVIGHVNGQHPAVKHPAGRGLGDTSVTVPTVGAMGGRPPFQSVGDVRGPAGRGIGNMTAPMAGGGRPLAGVIGDSRPPVDVRAKTGGSNPQGMRGTASPVGAMMGRGAGSPPFLHPTALGPSQAYPAYTGVTNAPSESVAQLMAGGRGRGGYQPAQSYSSESMTQQLSSMGYPAQPQQYMSSSSETEDDSQYQDAPSWVGGGYSGDLDPSPSFSNSTSSMNSNYQAAAASRSASATSVASNPQVVGSWADEVEKSFPIPGSVASSDSLSSDSDFPDVSNTQTVSEATKQLRKIRKKLRQIDELDVRKRQGVTLDQESEAKWQSRAVLIAQAAHLQQRFGLP